MPNLKLYIPAYEKATAQLEGIVLNNFENRNPFLGFLGPSQLTRHGGPVRNIGDPDPLDQVMQPIFVSSQIDFSVIRSTDIEAYAQILKNMAQSVINKTSSGYWQSIDEMFDHSRDMAQKRTKIAEEIVSYDVILDRLEKTHITFDKDGRPILHNRLHSGSIEQQKHLEETMTPEHERRLQEIIQQKMELFYAQKRIRRLS